MKKLLRLPLLLVLLVAGSFLSGCVGAGVAVGTGPVGPYYDYGYYGPVYRPYYRPYYRRPVVVRRAPVIVSPGPRHYQPRGKVYQGGSYHGGSGIRGGGGSRGGGGRGGR